MEEVGFGCSLRHIGSKATLHSRCGERSVPQAGVIRTCLVPRPPGTSAGSPSPTLRSPLLGVLGCSRVNLGAAQGSGEGTLHTHGFSLG